MHPVAARSYARDPRLRTVVCGSYRRDPVRLRGEYEQLQAAGCVILSPLSLEFVDAPGGFVRAAHELDQPPAQIEQQHLTAMQVADFIWLHCPDGYVGDSAGMELGFAHALGLRVFASCPPAEQVLADLVQIVASPAHAARAAAQDAEAPARALAVLQRYYARTCYQRGWEGEDPAEILELLEGEVQELREALDAGDDRAARWELADVQLYVTHMANIRGWDLGRTVTEKERFNCGRFPRLPGR